MTNLYTLLLKILTASFLALAMLTVPMSALAQTAAEEAIDAINSGTNESIGTTLDDTQVPNADGNAINQTGTFDCTSSDQARPTSQNDSNFKEINDAVRNWLLNAFTYSSVGQRLRCDPLIVGVLDEETGVPTTTSVYKVALNLVNFGVLIILLIVAFANILRVKLDTYAIKKVVPLLVFGVIMANLSLPIIRTVVDFSGVLTATFIGSTGDVGTRRAFVEEVVAAVYQGGVRTLGTTMKNLETGITGGTGTSFGWGGFLALVGFGGFAVAAFGPFFVLLLMGTVFLVLIPAILFFILGLLFVARIYVLVILAAVSPIAFASLGFEPLKGKVWGWWWNQFFRWTFMAPATFALFWLATRFYQAVGSQMDIGTYALTLTLVTLAIGIPLKMGGTIMGKWNDVLVKPIQGALTAPFRGAQEYVTKGGARDVSRFASSKTLANVLALGNPRLRQALEKRGFGAIPLNMGRAFKEGAAKIDAKNAEKEANSKAVKLGQGYGTMIAESGLRSVVSPGGQQAARAKELTTANGRERLVSLAEDFLNKTVGRERNWSQIESQQPLKENFEHAQEEALKSGDLDKIIAARLAHALLGKSIKGTEYRSKFDDALKTKGMSPVDVHSFADYVEGHVNGFPILTEAQVSDDDLVRNAQSTELMKRMVSMIESQAKDPIKQQQTLEAMLRELKTVTKDFKDLKEIEKNPNYAAMAGALIQKVQTLPSNIQSDVRTKLMPLRNQVGMADARQVFGIDNVDGPALLRAAKIDWPNLNSVVQHQGLTADGFRDLNDAQQEAVMKLVGSPALRSDIKKALRAFISKELERAAKDNIITDSNRADFVNRSLDDIINDNDNLKPPMRIDSSHLAAAGISGDRADEIMRRLKPYQSAINSIEYLTTSANSVAGPTANLVDQQANKSPNPSGPTGPR